MAKDARFAYLQARLQARHGDRPSPDDWRVAESSADLSHYLEAIRRSALKRWVGDLNHEMEPETIERQLRATWRDAVDETASWAPEEWRPAVEWLRWLPDLPAVEHLLRGAKVAPWMRTDPVMRDIAFDEPTRRREALAETALAPLLPPDAPEKPDLQSGLAGGDGAVGDGAPPANPATHAAAAWLTELQRRLPAAGRDPDGPLADIVALVDTHIETMRSSDAPGGRRLRNTLAEQLARRFRRGAGTATALFSHLLLDGLELERVRAGIMARRLMPERTEGRSWA